MDNLRFKLVQYEKISDEIFDIFNIEECDRCYSIVNYANYKIRINLNKNLEQIMHIEDSTHEIKKYVSYTKYKNFVMLLLLDDYNGIYYYGIFNEDNIYDVINY